MADPTTTDLLATAETNSKTAHKTNVTNADQITAANSIIAEEIATGVDRTRDAVHFHDELNVYDMVSVGSAGFEAVYANLRTVVEMVIRLTNPTNLLQVGVNVVSPARLGIGSLTIANTPHLDYFERFMNPGALVYDVVSMQNLRDGVYPKVWDCVALSMANVAHDFSIVDGLYAQLPAGGSIILGSAGDQGNVARYGNNHEYVTCFDSLMSNSDCFLYQIPSGLGAAVAIKSR